MTRRLDEAAKLANRHRILTHSKRIADAHVAHRAFIG
jgi:hypothetical protein